MCGKGSCIYILCGTKRFTANVKHSHDTGVQYRVIKGATVAKIFQADFAVKTFRSNSSFPRYARARMFHSRTL